jgi:hypothetical protein
MDSANPATSRTDAAFSGDLIDLIAEDGLLNLSDDPLPILKAQPESLWAGDPVRSRYGIKLVNALLPIVKGRLNRNSNVHAGSPLKELSLAQARATMWTPKVLSTPHMNMVTIGHWVNGVMDEEYLFWDNASYVSQLFGK